MTNPPPPVSKLLFNLKSTVELLIQFRGDSLTSKYGAIERLRVPILAILSHELKTNTGDVYEQLWQVIVRLNANSQRYIHLLQEIYHKENIRISVEQWIDQSVINQCLSQQVSCAENDAELLQQYYHREAFMRMPSFHQAFLLCLQTVEGSDPTLLIKIDPKLSIVAFPQPISAAASSSFTLPNQTAVSPSLVTDGKSRDDNPNKFHPFSHQRVLHRRIHSDPVFSSPNDSSQASRSRVVSTLPTPIADGNQLNPIPSISYLQPDDCGSYGSSYDSRGDLAEHATSQKPSRLPTASAAESNRQSISSQITLIDEDDLFPDPLSTLNNPDDGGLFSISSSSPMEQSVTTSTGDYSTRTVRLPHSSLLWPRKGQTLDEYIRECDSKTRTDVEKENAHFYFSEAIISAIEQIKFTQQCNKYFSSSWSSSIAQMLSPCETVHTSSSNSSASPPMSNHTPCNSRLVSSYAARMGLDHSQDEVNADMLQSTSESAEPPNNFDWSVRSSFVNSSAEDSSAEAIALTLMDIWKNYKVPAATELFWMIPHDEDLPQKVLPLPDGISIDPHEDHLLLEGGQRILCRGNGKWAPPREQLIFHIHQAVNRETQLKEQNYLCAGCGRHVEKGFAHRYRYCEYTGKYFCRSCHSDKRTFLPSYIINKWDFSGKHSVSNFAYDYLSRIYSDPIFHINHLNPKLFERNRPLKSVGDLRWSLHYLQQYILHCRLADEKGYQGLLKKLPSYTYTDPHVYSVDDLFKTKSGDLFKELQPIVNHLREHVSTCPICYGQGHICQICGNGKEIIFPFNLETTSVCQVCQSCFHSTCHERQSYRCPKCPRKKRRSDIALSNRSSTPTNTPQDEDTIT